MFKHSKGWSLNRDVDLSLSSRQSPSDLSPFCAGIGDNSRPTTSPSSHPILGQFGVEFQATGLEPSQATTRSASGSLQSRCTRSNIAVRTSIHSIACACLITILSIWYLLCMPRFPSIMRGQKKSGINQIRAIPRRSWPRSRRLFTLRYICHDLAPSSHPGSWIRP